jgi:hypothetical protein
MKEIEKPVGDFIMDNATGVQGVTVFIIIIQKFVNL